MIWASASTAALCVIGLDEAFLRLHNAAVRIGEVAGAALGLGSSGSGGAGLPGFLQISALRCCCFSASMRRSSSAASFGVGLQRRHRLLDLRQPFRLIAGPVNGISSPRLSLCRKSRPLGHLPSSAARANMQAASAFNSASRFLHAFITHRFMFRRIRFDLRAIQCDVAEFDQPCRLAQLPEPGGTTRRAPHKWRLRKALIVRKSGGSSA